MRIGFSCYSTPRPSAIRLGGDTSRRSTPYSSGQRRILHSSCCDPSSPLARGVDAKRTGCRCFGLWWFAAIVALFIAIPSYATDSTDRKTVTSRKYVDDQIATKQPILNASGTDLRNNVVMYTNQAGEVTSKPISTTLSGTGIDNNLPTVGAVNTGLAAKQNEIGAGTASGNVVTYTGSPGTVGEKPVYNSNATYNSNALIEANHANSAIRKGLNDHLSCVDGNRGPNNECWLWTIEDQAINTVYTPHNN